MSGDNYKCERLERILNGLRFGALELISSEEEINLIKEDLRNLGYKVSCEVHDKKNPDEEKRIYHLHITKISER